MSVTQMCVIVVIIQSFHAISFVALLLHRGAAFLSVTSFILLSSSGQVVVPEELRFPHACCVGIASQTSLSLFNPSERWQQVSVTVTSLAIDGEKVRGAQRADRAADPPSKRACWIRWIE